MDDLFPITAMPNSFTEDENGKTVRFYLIKGARIEEDVLRKLALAKDLDVTITNESDSLSLEFNTGTAKEVVITPTSAKDVEVNIDPIAQDVAPRDVERLSRIAEFIRDRVRKPAQGKHKTLPNGQLIITVETMSVGSSEIRALLQNDKTIDAFSIFAIKNDKGKRRVAIEFLISPAV